MSSLTEKQIQREDIYNGEVLHLVKDRVLLPNGKTSTREMCLHIGAVAIIPILGDGRVVMERQYRYAQEREYLEIPAGKLNTPDEDLLEAAKRELSEETGAIANEWIYLGEIDTTPALMNEKIHLYLAKDISFSERHLDEDEFLNVEFIPLSDLLSMVERGEIMDAKTQIAVLKAALFHK